MDLLQVENSQILLFLFYKPFILHFYIYTQIVR